MPVCIAGRREDRGWGITTWLQSQLNMSCNTKKKIGCGVASLYIVSILVAPAPCTYFPFSQGITESSLSCDMPLPVATVEYCICAFHCPIGRLFNLPVACAVNSVIQTHCNWPEQVTATSSTWFVRQKNRKMQIAYQLPVRSCGGLRLCVECGELAEAVKKRVPVSGTGDAPSLELHHFG